MATDRERVLDGIEAAVGERGYAATTIADIVRHARSSKRTFYEHFADKEACFLDAYRRAAGELQALLRASHDPEAAPTAQVDTTLTAYLTALDLDPVRAKIFLLEIYAAGPMALAVRRQVHQEFADLLFELSQRAKVEHVSVEIAIALVGALHELVLVALERGQSVLMVAGPARAVATAVLFPAPLTPVLPSSG